MTDEKNVVEPMSEDDVEVITEAEALGEAEAIVEDESIDYKAKFEQAEAQAAESKEQALRAVAEVENLRKRQARELENAHKYALENFAKEVIGVWDSLELGINAAKGENASIEKLLEGSDLTLKMMNDVMGKFGVEQIDPDGQPFDADLHQAMSMVPRDDVPANTVVTVIQKGFSLNGRLIRPAMVMVSQGGAPRVDEEA